MSYKDPNIEYVRVELRGVTWRGKDVKVTDPNLENPKEVPAILVAERYNLKIRRSIVPDGCMVFTHESRVKPDQTGVYYYRPLVDEEPIKKPKIVREATVSRYA